MTEFPLTASLERNLGQMSHGELAQVFTILDKLTVRTTMSLLFRQTGGRLRGGARRVMSALGRRWSRGRYRVRRREKQLDADELKDWLLEQTSETESQYTPDQLREKILPALVSRSSFRGPLRDEIDCEYALLTVFRDVGKEYGVDTSAQQIRRLPEKAMQAITEDLLERSRTILGDVSAEQREEILRRIHQNLDSMDPEAREELRQSLGVEELTASAMLQALRSGAAVGGALMAANATGMGVFLFVTTVTHAIFTTLLGIVVPFAVYQTLTTVLGVLLGPVGLLVVLGVGALTMLRNRPRFDRRVMGQVLFHVYGTELLQGCER